MEGSHWLPCGTTGAGVGMLVVETIAKIRRAFFVQKKPIKVICRELHVSRKVVANSGAGSYPADAADGDAGSDPLLDQFALKSAIPRGWSLSFRPCGIERSKVRPFIAGRPSLRSLFPCRRPPPRSRRGRLKRSGRAPDAHRIGSAAG